MALLKCAECGKNVSSEAKKCPSCGAKVRLPKKPTSPILKFALLGIAAMAIVIMYMSGQASKEIAQADQDRLAAMTPEKRSTEVARRQAQAASAAAATAAQAQAASVADALLHDVGMAEVTCSMYAEKRAHDPSSVEWIADEKNFAYTSKDSTHATSVQAMRAKNAMGALVRGAVKCALVKDSTGWNVAKFEQL